MRWVWIAAWTYLILVLHTGVARDLAIAGCAPHLLLAGLILLVVRTSVREGMILAAVWGLLSDCLAGDPLGPDVIAFTFVAYMIRRASRANHLAAWGMGLEWALCAWGALLVSMSLRMLGDGHVPAVAALPARTAGPAIYTAGLVAILSVAVRLVRGAPSSDEGGPAVFNQWRRLTG
jgi:rod shape-determining protein MreD